MNRLFWQRPPLSIPLNWSGFGQAVAASLSAHKFQASNHPPSSEMVACASVRTGFDLILRQLKIPAGSEVIISGVTIQHMVDIIEHHGLKPVPVDIRPDTLGPDARDIAARINSKTRMILITHLFGFRLSMDDYAAIADKHQLILIEDSAQALAGKMNGHPRTDFALFSFGAIKDYTALGGAAVICRTQFTANQLRQLEELLPWRSEFWFLKRIARYFALKCIATPPLYGLICLLIKCITRHDGESTLYQLSRGFSSGELMNQIRHRGSPGSRQFLLKRLASIDSVQWQKAMKNIRSAVMKSGLNISGPMTPDRSWWVIPVLSPNRNDLVGEFRRRGIAASPIAGSLIVVHGQDDDSLRQCHQLMSQVIFVSKDSISQRLLSLGQFGFAK